MTISRTETYIDENCSSVMNEGIMTRYTYVPTSANIFIPVQAYIPEIRKDDSLMIFFHGSGWILGDSWSTDNWCRELVSRTGITLVSVSLKCNPGEASSVPVEDSHDVFKWIVKNPEKLGISFEKIILCGDGAGGYLAAAVSLEARKRTGLSVSALCLMYPIVGQLSDNSQLDDEKKTLFSNPLFTDDRTTILPFASSLIASSLCALPPVAIVAVENDPLHKMARAFTDRLGRVGNRVAYRYYSKRILSMMGKNNLSENAIDDIEEMLDFLRSYFLS